jgi:hypothetical protein
LPQKAAASRCSLLAHMNMLSIRVNWHNIVTFIPQQIELKTTNLFLFTLIEGYDSENFNPFHAAAIILHSTVPYKMVQLNSIITTSLLLGGMFAGSCRNL